jgi:cyclase
MYEFKALAENVYVFVQPALVWYSTAGVIVGERDVIVVDSLTNEAMAGALLAEIRKVTDKPIRFLINTHAHPDHVYTNHLFHTATAVCSQRGREKTREFLSNQALHDETFARLFPDVDFTGGRYTLQDMAFTGRLSLYQGAREIRVIELGPGHSESDVIVHLPAEQIVFCGDLFMNGMPPMPGEGHVTATIANMKALEALGAETYVAGHGHPGARMDIARQRSLLESLTSRARQCFERGLSYDEALDTFEGSSFPIDFARPTVLSAYCEWIGKMPESRNQTNTNHMLVMSLLAREVQLRIQGMRSG